ncbi:MAG: aminomethyl-transferring glycine dehydrogenase subunit GcvPB [Clostridia bacterium]|nr:aminomethyl-transferring glycine dehydrogenase subunit GcvPB [Clostridia bacterium]
MKTIFETGARGRGLDILPKLDVPEAAIPDSMKRASAPRLPQVSEVELSRHYSRLEKRSFGVNDGFYPLGSCTMKYNPAIDEEMASLTNFASVHPLQGEKYSQGCLEILYTAQKWLCEITGMDMATMQPAAGAHGEFTGLAIIKAYHASRGDCRDEIVIPDSAHGTNPASASMAGFKVVSVKSGEDGCVDVEALKKAVGPKTAGLMLTNPNTLGVFDRNISEITRIIHDAGGLNYYDGANLNAIAGVVKPGDMGFDVTHLNLHKTFATPHGGGGPGSGPVAVKTLLADFLPDGVAVKTADGYALSRPGRSIGRVRSFCGNFSVVVKAVCYMLSLGGDGIREASQVAVLNANYLKKLVCERYESAVDGICMHEFVLTLEGLKKETGLSALDVAKALIDRGMHPPTMYFPLIVHEALMFEPTETESPEMLEYASKMMKEIYDKALSDPDSIHRAPTKTVIGRPDEVEAARNPVIKFY